MKTVYITRNDLFKDIPLVLCNEILKADTDFMQDNLDIFFSACDECDSETSNDCEYCGGEEQVETEPYQYFITSLSDWKKEQLQAYGVVFGYSNLLEVDILPIYDFGTGWNAFSYSKEVDDEYTLAPNETLERTTVY